MSTVPRNIPEGWPLGEELNGPAVAVRDAFAGEAIAQVRQATLDDVTNAVEAARTYLPPPRAALRAGVLHHQAHHAPEQPFQVDFAGHGLGGFDHRHGVQRAGGRTAPLAVAGATLREAKGRALRRVGLTTANIPGSRRPRGLST